MESKFIIKCTLVFLLLSAAIFARAQEGFISIYINKQVKDFKDTVDISGPLPAFISSMYMQANGKQGSLFSGIFTDAFRGEFRNKKDSKPDNAVRDMILNRNIYELINYKDSVAGIISDHKGGKYLIGFVRFENGKWKNAGEDIRNTIEEARGHFTRRADEQLKISIRLDALQHISSDTLSFISFIKENQKSPEEFILSALAGYPLVIYGETHFRRISWDLMKSLINNPAFPELAGTVFVEHPVHSQQRFDRFFESETLQPQIILDILGEQHYWGWDDKGFYEFCMELWQVNRNLPEQKKIKLMATDLNLPWLSINNRDEYKSYRPIYAQDRENSMADVIENYIRSGPDNRNHLFIVGNYHAMKNNFNSRLIKAAALLVERFSADSIFSILTHGPCSDNYGGVFGKARNGLFDYVFEKTGNQPLAFPLKNSPFGKEPYDMSEEWRAEPLIGNYEDCYDGYIFLGPVEEEEASYVLYEMFTEEYIVELKRRAEILQAKKIWGIPVEEVTSEKLMNKRKAHGEGKRYKFD